MAEYDENENMMEQETVEADGIETALEAEELDDAVVEETAAVVVEDAEEEDEDSADDAGDEEAL